MRSLPWKVGLVPLGSRMQQFHKVRQPDYGDSFPTVKRRPRIFNDALDDWHDDLTVVRGHPHESGSTEHTFEAFRQQVQELNRD